MRILIIILLSVIVCFGKPLPTPTIQSAFVFQGTNSVMGVTYSTNSAVQHVQMVIGTNHIVIRDSIDGFNWNMVIDCKVYGAHTVPPGWFRLERTNNAVNRIWPQPVLK